MSSIVGCNFDRHHLEDFVLGTNDFLKFEVIAWNAIIGLKKSCCFHDPEA